MVLSEDEDEDYGLAAAFAGDDYEDTDYVAPDSDSDQEEDELRSASRSRKNISRGKQQARSPKRTSPKLVTSKPRASYARGSQARGSHRQEPKRGTSRSGASSEAKVRPTSNAMPNPKARSMSTDNPPTTSGPLADDGELGAGDVLAKPTMLLPPSAYRPYQRKSTVYDCTAGRMHSWLPGSLRLHEKRDPWDPHAGLADLKRVRVDALRREKPYEARRRPMAPQDVLSSFSQAPTRYAEYDVYRPHVRELGTDASKKLPSSLMLSALHTYSGRLYGTVARQHWLDNHERIYKKYRRRAKESRHKASKMRARLLCAYERLARGLKHDNIDERSMDETALLALGILMEETATESLAEKGFLVLAEGDGQYEASMHRRDQSPSDDEGLVGSAEEVYTDDEEAFYDDDSYGEAEEEGGAVSQSKRRGEQSATRPRKKVRRT